MDFSHLKVVITGVMGGIGYTLANILHEYGATVIGVYNNRVRDDVLFDTYKCDITNEEDIPKDEEGNQYSSDMPKEKPVEHKEQNL